MHRVVVVLGVGRIDGDERQLAPVLAAAFEARGLGGLRLGQRLAAERHAECRAHGSRSGSTARSLLSEPSRSFTRAVGKPEAARGA